MPRPACLAVRRMSRPSDDETGKFTTGSTMRHVVVMTATGSIGLLAIFIVDASWTLLWRVVTGQPFTRPHRLHAYQRLSSHWGSHLRVDLLCGGIFCGWLLPLAWLAEVHPNYGFLLVILAYLPLLLVMAKTRPVA